MPRHICDEVAGLSDKEKWKYLYGTDAYGNLPQHKKDQHVGHCYAPCPYSTQSDTQRSFHMLGNDFDLSTRYNHTGPDGTIYYMEVTNKGSKWGFECTFSGCPFNVANGKRYFYV